MLPEPISRSPHHAQPSSVEPAAPSPLVRRYADGTPVDEQAAPYEWDADGDGDPAGRPPVWPRPNPPAPAPATPAAASPHPVAARLASLLRRSARPPAPRRSVTPVVAPFAPVASHPPVAPASPHAHPPRPSAQPPVFPAGFASGVGAASTAGWSRIRDASMVLWQQARRRPLPGASPRPGIPAIYLYVRATHILLAVGLLALALSLATPWGTDKHGAALYLRDFTSPQLASSGVPVTGWAISTASNLVMWGFGLGLVLVLATITASTMDLAAYRANMPGCLPALLSPLIWLAGLLLVLDLLLATGFGLLGLISQLPGLYAVGLSNQAATAPALGFYLWWIGILLAFIGTVGQMGPRRRMVAY